MRPGDRFGRRHVLAAAAALPGAVARAADDGEVSIPQGGGAFAAIRAAPAAKGAAPTVLVASGGTAVDDPVQAFCRRLAQAGYIALSPDLAADGDTGALARLETSAAWAAVNGGDAKRLFMTGFGSGGRLAWLFAAQSSNLRAAVAWGSTAGVGQKAGPIDVAATLRAPVLGLYGSDDPANPRDALLALERKGRSSGHAVEIVTYTGAAADFALPGRAGYDEAAALDGWQRMRAWFRRFGGK